MKESNINVIENISPAPFNLDVITSHRDQMYRISFWSSFGIGGMAFWTYLLLNNPQGNLLTLAAYILIFAVLVIIASSSRVPYIARASSVALFLFLAGIACLIHDHQITAASLFIFSSLVLVGLMLGKRAVIGWGAVTILTLILVSLLTNSNINTQLLASTWTGQINAFITILIYSLIASCALIPITQNSLNNRSVLELGKQLSQENEQLNHQLIDLSNNLNQVYEGQQKQQEKLNKFTQNSSINKPIDELLIDGLTDIHKLYGYTQIEVFVDGGMDTYHHAILSIEAESGFKRIYDTIQVSSFPEIVWETIHESRIVMSSHSESPIENEDISCAILTHFWQICIPLKIDQQVIGALMIKGISGDDIKTINRSELELIASVLALKAVNNQLAGDKYLNPVHYHRTNLYIHRLSQASSIEEISSIVDEILSGSPFLSFYFRVEKNMLHLISFHNPEGSAHVQLEKMTIPIDRGEGIIVNTPILLRDIYNNSKIPTDLLSIFQQLNVESAAFLPIQPNSQISRLIVLASQRKDDLTPFSIQPFALIAGYATTAIEKTITYQHLQRRLIALQSLASISQAISMVTDLDELYDSIHEQVTQVVGEVDLAIALYDPKTDLISIPYAHEAGQKIALEPFPLGQGLTSILIRTQQPLLLVEDTERRARELGAKITGAPAKSWLGVPLIVSGEVLGAILLQDIEHEQRFNEDDLRLITTLASQVAITVRNVRLLQESNLRAERERIVSDITSKIWSSPDVESIARNALQELSRSLQVSEGSIFLQSAESSETLRRLPGIREN